MEQRPGGFPAAFVCAAAALASFGETGECPGVNTQGERNRVKIGDDVRAVWVASVPRTGSMWTYNVASDLVRSPGRQVLPESVPHADEEMEAIGRQGLATSGKGVYVL